MARHVEDLALALDVLATGEGPGLAPPVPLGDFRSVELGKLWPEQSDELLVLCRFVA